MINLGNVAGVVRSDNPPLEADLVTVKKYVLWAKPIDVGAGTFQMLYFDTVLNAWVSFETFLANLQALADSVNATIGDLGDLNTPDTTNIVASINSILTSIANFIDDVNVSTTKGYSSNKIEQLFTGVRNDILGAVSADFNTLEKIEGKINGIGAAATSAVLFIVQALTEAQKQQARDNIDVYSKDEIGDVTEDLLTFYNNL